MPGPVITSSSTVMCGHGGNASHIPAQLRVLAGGSPIAVASSQHMVAGCALSSSSGPFCTVLSWTAPAARVMAGGLPVLVQSSVPMGVGPGVVVAPQPRVQAQ